MAYSQETREKIQSLHTAAQEEIEVIRLREASSPRQKAERRLEIAQVKETLAREIEAAKKIEKDAMAARKAEKEECFTTSGLSTLANRLMTDHFAVRGEPTVRYWQNNWLHWQKGTWALIKDRHLSGMIADVAVRPKDEGGLGISNLPHREREEILTFLRHRSHIPDTQEFETWLPARTRKGAEIDTVGTWINCEKGLFRCADTSDVKFIAHTPRYFSFVKIPRRPDSTTPVEWLKFLNEVLEGDAERIAVLQEWFGYCCLPTTRYHKMLMLFGPGGNGKSTILNVLQELLGAHNCSHVELSDLNTAYGPFSTFGKAANICGDIATRYLKNPGRIKAFVGGDGFRFEQKYMNAFSAQPTAKLVFSMNDLPKTDDDSDGFWRRMLTLPITFRPETPNPIFANHKHPKWPFRDELDSIFWWGLEGLCRLLGNHDFTVSRVITAASEEWRLGNEGVRRYALERLSFDPSSDTCSPCDFISADYAIWATRNRERPFSALGLGKRLRKIYPELVTVQRTRAEKKVHAWRGLRIHPEAPIFPAT